MHSTQTKADIEVGLRGEREEREERGKERDLRNPNDVTGNLHVLTGFLATLVAHPIMVSINESGWDFPF